MIKITAIVENVTPEGLAAEHGLALLIQTERHRILMDTGAGGALLPNAEKLGVSLTGLTHVFLSHGHYDHTGGLKDLPGNIPVYAAPGIAAPCYSRQPDGGMHHISMPEASRRRLEQGELHVIRNFTEFAPGVFSTGPIPRKAPSDNGKVFHSDPEGTIVNTIPEEQSLLLQEGILITGCCHAGIVNTLEACRTGRPDIPVKVFIGGMHLLYADEHQLEHISEYLNRMNLEKIILLHCTGDGAKQYLQAHLNCQVLIGTCGDSWTFQAEPSVHAHL